MVDDETVAAIAEATRPVELSKWDVFWRIIAGVAAVIAITAASVSISTHYAQTNTARCINNNLGIRNAPNLADKAAEDAMFSGWAAALAHPGPDTVGAITTALARYEAQRATDDQARAANPIGQC